MTSTRFQIGLTTAEKNSSRVLRPPGGGHSDIFGLKDNQNEIMTPNKKRNHPQSTISSCFNMVDEPKVQTKPKEVENSSNGDEPVEQNDKSEADNGIDENEAPGENLDIAQHETVKEQTSPAPRRGRVPPGGFSSGLW